MSEPFEVGLRDLSSGVLDRNVVLRIVREDGISLNIIIWVRSEGICTFLHTATVL